MKKSELIKLLQEIEGDPEIVVPETTEGGGFWPLLSVEIKAYLNGAYYNIDRIDTLEGTNKAICMLGDL